MPIVTFTEGDLRDPNESAETYSAVEGPVERDDDGNCHCEPLRVNPWDEDLELYAELLKGLSEYWDEPREKVGAFLREQHLAVPIERPRRHMHLKVWGRNPEAAPRYYELPLSLILDRARIGAYVRRILLFFEDVSIGVPGRKKWRFR